MMIQQPTQWTDNTILSNSQFMDHVLVIMQVVW